MNLKKYTFTVLSLVLLLNLGFSQNENEEKKWENMQESMGNLLGSIMNSKNSSEEKEVPPQYNFDYKMLIETREEGEESTDVNVAWDKKMSYIAFLESDQYLVFDNKQSIIVQYSLEDQEMMVMPNFMPEATKFLQNNHDKDTEQEDVKITKTGKRKTIMGLNCEEVIVETDEDISNNWITYDLEVSLFDLLQKSASVAPETYIDGKYADEFQGAMPIYSESTNKKTGKKSYMEMKDFQKGFSLDNGTFQRQ